jgi:DNA-binding PadR family transcriptional regulator
MATDAPGAPGTRPGTSTRLLILGCVRIFQPVHGYFLRRELLSWKVDAWASVHPGSIYNALRSLTAQGLLAEVRTTTASSRPARTSYCLTPDGEAAYTSLIRGSLVSVDDPTAFLVAVNFAPSLARAEMIELVEERARVLRSRIEREPDELAAFLARRDTPPSASETMRVMTARSAGELRWCEDYLGRIRGGAYSFVGEEPDWVPSPEQIAEAIAAGVGSFLEQGDASQLA